MDYFSSPVNYQGNKKQYLNVVYKAFGCHRYVEKICDVFAGSFTVGANMLTVYQDSIVECNDLREALILLYDKLAHTEYSQVEDYVKNISERYQLLSKNPNMKEGYESLKTFYNQNPQANILSLIPLTMCCFNGDASFDNMIFKGRFGKRCVTPYQIDKLKIFHSVLYENNQRIKFSHLSFDAIDYSQYTPNDILYFDPPYFLSSVLYGSGWNRDMEAKLYNIIIDLHNRHIPFALSNLLEYKGRKNYLLEQLLKINGIESEDAQTDYRKLQRCSKQMKELYSHYPHKEIVVFS